MNRSSSKGGSSNQTEESNRIPIPAGLYLVATPIGHLSDISPRAVDTLKNVDLVLAEDTRTFGVLAKRYGIDTPTRSYHEHNERRVAVEIVDEIKSGKAVGLVSDAGTPTLNDPGYHLVNLCHAEGVPVDSIPGPCSFIVALSLSGFPLHRFTYEGFLSKKPGKRKRTLEHAITSGITTVFLESPYRVIKVLKEIEQISSAVDVFVARELTKLYQETLLGKVQTVREKLEARGTLKGEFVIVIRGGENDEDETSDEESQADS